MWFAQDQAARDEELGENDLGAPWFAAKATWNEMLHRFLARRVCLQ